MSLPRLRALEQEALHPRVCGVCKGDGEIFRNPSWPMDPQEETSYPCPACGGTGERR